MTATAAFHIRQADWRRDEASIARLRREIFIDEQHVPEALEWEAIDATCRWFVAESVDGIVGVARLLADGRIGRMAVRRAWRGRGVGSALLEAALNSARQSGLGRVTLSAQVQAMPFYVRAGFRAQGMEYLDADIPHRSMFKEL